GRRGRTCSINRAKSMEKNAMKDLQRNDESYDNAGQHLRQSRKRKAWRNDAFALLFVTQWHCRNGNERQSGAQQMEQVAQYGSGHAPDEKAVEMHGVEGAAAVGEIGG